MSDAQPITGCRPGDIAPQVFVCGDPARVARIAAGWDERRTVRVVREYTIVSGSKDGVPLTAASHGIGAPGAAVLLEELIKLGASTIIRIGNSGALDPNAQIGDLAITTGCVRDDGTSKTYVIPEYPAVADYRIVGALVDAAGAVGARAHTGITWSLDAFYVRNAVAGPGGRMTSMSVGGYWPSPLEARIRDMQQARVLNCEMEAGRAADAGGALRRARRRDLRGLGPNALAGTVGDRSRPQHGGLHRGRDPRDAGARSGVAAPSSLQGARGAKHRTRMARPWHGRLVTSAAADATVRCAGAGSGCA
jgi:uridine phosphorylase